MSSKILSRIYQETGLRAVVLSPRDTKILCLQRVVRFVAYGSTSLVLALFLSKLEVSDERIGLFMTLTLLGDVVISLVLTLIADGIGRRKMLMLGALLMAASGVVFALTSNYWVLVAASVFGVISPSGNEIGPFRAIEESTLVHLSAPVDRTSILAWYAFFGLIGASMGIISFGWILQSLQSTLHWDPLAAYRVVFWAYSGLGVIKLILCLFLSSDCEPDRPHETPPLPQAQDETQPLLVNGVDDRPKTPIPSTSKKPSVLRSLLPPISKESAAVVFKLCLLFALDSFASGLTPVSWQTYFFHQKFHLKEGKLGSVFFVTSVLSAFSNIAAAPIARRIGLIKTMVLTHVPASVALALIPVPNSAFVAVMLLAIRASTNSMDQAPRQAFIAAAVLPGERTAVMGAVNVVKTLSQSVGPVVTGALAERSLFWVAFIVAGSLKLLYDFLILGMFLGYRTVEERAEERLNDERRVEDEEREEREEREEIEPT